MRSKFKRFLILHRGRIVYERYFGALTPDNNTLRCR